MQRFVVELDSKEFVSELGAFAKGIRSFCEQASYLGEPCIKLVHHEEPFDSIFIELVLNLGKSGVHLVVSLLLHQGLIVLL